MGLYLGGGAVAVLLLELFCLDIDVGAVSFPEIEGFFESAKRFRFGTEEGGGIAAASAFSSFFLGVATGGF